MENAAVETELFLKIKERVLEWGEAHIRNHADYIEITKKEEDILLFDLTFPNCLGQIVVHNVSFAPYRCLSFEVMTMDTKTAIESGRPELIYFFYDSEDTPIEEMIEKLDEGVKHGMCYLPDR